MTLNTLPPNRDVVVAHSSDLHVDHDHTARLHGGDGTAGLACVLHAARAAGADVAILAGDTFDCHRLPQELLDRAADVIAAAGLPVVILPGNPDPAVSGAGSPMPRRSCFPGSISKSGGAPTATIPT